MAAGGESRFGFGQGAGSVGAILLGVGVAQPWLSLDGPRAAQAALVPGALDREVAGQVLTVFAPGGTGGRAAADRVAEQLGIAATGWAQSELLAAVVLVAALLSLIGVVRSVTASTAWAARRQARLLGCGGVASLVAAGLGLWVLSPEPQAAMRPAVGLWLVVAGAAFVLLGALTLGNDRRRGWLEDHDPDEPKKAFEGTKHLVYSHGAWVPRNFVDA